MGNQQIPTVDPLAALLAAIISVLPFLFILNRQAVDETAPWLLRNSLFQKLTRRNPRIRSRLSVVAGLVLGVAAAGAARFLGNLLVGDETFVLRPGSALGWSLMISFILAGLLEEALKCTLALAGGFLLTAKIQREETSSFPDRRRGRIHFLRSTPFLAAGVGLGFALYENQTYFSNIPPGALPSLFFSRTLISAPVHILISLLFGLLLLSCRRGGLFNRIATALLLCVFIHGLFDFFAISPEPFPRSVAIFVLILLAGVVLERFFRSFPEARLRRIAVVLPGADSTHTAGRSESAYPSPGFVISLIRDPHALLRPPPRPDYPGGSDATRFGNDVKEDGAAAPDSASWRTDEGRRQEIDFYRRILEPRGFQCRIRDSWTDRPAVLGEGSAGLPRATAAGVAPDFSLLEFFYDRAPTDSGRGVVLTVSCGLHALLGCEFWVAFPGSFPPLRLFFQALVADPGKISPCLPFRILPLSADLMGSYVSFMILPLIDPLRKWIRKELSSREKLPHEILFFDEIDERIIREHGISAYFMLLREVGISWGNDYFRPPLDDLIRIKG